jgi:DNA-directed RNA polymerase specialized sigma24 family protein
VKSGWTYESPTSSDWQRWLADHAPKLLLFARQQTRREADAQDLLQESIVESWQRQGNGAPPPLPLVFATIRRRAIDLARSENRRTHREMAALPVLEADDVEIDRRLITAFEAVATLPTGEPVRFRCSEWSDEVVLRDRARGVVIEQRTPRFEVVPVRFETY